MKKSQTKKALLLSALSLVLCFAMLVGTTFAWFTDSVTSGGNVIKAGNLDIKVEYSLDGENWKDLDGATDLFQKGPWEPGHTEVVALRIKNEGTLALKYQGKINVLTETSGTNVYGEEFNLSDYLTISTFDAPDDGSLGAYMVSMAFAGDYKTLYSSTTDLNNAVLERSDKTTPYLIPGMADFIVVKIDMPETVGNEANAISTDKLPSIELGINVLAAQVPSPAENDSFGYEYDKDATYPQILVDKPYTQNYTATAPYTVDGNGVLVQGEATAEEVFTWGIDPATGWDTIPAMSTMFSSADGSLVTVNDITFTGTMSAVMAGHYVGYSADTSGKFHTEFNNVNIVDAEVVSFSDYMAPALVVYGTMTMNNCTVTGTTLSDLDTSPRWPVWDMSTLSYSDTTINNSTIGSIRVYPVDAKLTLNDSTVDSITVRGDRNHGNVTIVVGEGSTVGTIDMTMVQSPDHVHLTIAEGASVGEFVDNGVSYATFEDWKAAQ